jgi:hypothetical protein
MDAVAHAALRGVHRPAQRASFERILAYKPHPEMGYRSCLGLIRLAGQYSSSRMEAAAERALPTGTSRYQVRAEAVLTEEASAAGGGNIACSSRDMTEHAKS